MTARCKSRRFSKPEQWTIDEYRLDCSSVPTWRVQATTRSELLEIAPSPVPAAGLCGR
jgi:hypothetical protein